VSCARRTIPPLGRGQCRRPMDPLPPCRGEWCITGAMCPPPRDARAADVSCPRRANKLLVPAATTASELFADNMASLIGARRPGSE
jgi:hypothetical protein